MPKEIALERNESENKTLARQRTVSAAVGVVDILLVVSLSIIYPDPSPWQQFVLRGCLALGLAVLGSFVPGLLKVDAKLRGWGGYFGILAGGALAIFVIIWLLAPSSIPSRIQEAQKNGDQIAESKMTKAMLGIWYSDYTYSYRAGTVRILGTTEYFANGTNSFVGEMRITQKVSSGEAEILFNIDASNAWLVSDQELTITIIDIKDQFKSFTLNGVVQNLPPNFNTSKLPKVIDFVPKGKSTRFQIGTLEGGKGHLRAMDPLSGNFDFDIVKTRKYFVQS